MPAHSGYTQADIGTHVDWHTAHMDVDIQTHKQIHIGRLVMMGAKDSGLRLPGHVYTLSHKSHTLGAGKLSQQFCPYRGPGCSVQHPDGRSKL